MKLEPIANVPAHQEEILLSKSTSQSVYSNKESRVVQLQEEKGGCRSKNLSHRTPDRNACASPDSVYTRSQV